MDTLTLLDRLVGFDTTSAKSNLELIDFVQDFLATRDFRVARIPDVSGQKAGLYAEIGPAGDGILLSGHTDVVPIDGQVWTRDPFRLTSDQGRVYGRGTTDMKGFVASALALADKAAKSTLSEPLKIALSYDEEIGCVGIQQMQERLAPMIGTPRLCIVGEPTEMQVAVGHKGKAAIEAVCRGQSGHSALAPNFVNALHMATDFAVALRVIQTDLSQNGARDAAYSIPYSTIHIGKMIGGVALNIVPDLAELTFEYRHLPQDSAAEIFARITGAAAEIETIYKEQWPNAAIEIDRYNAYPGLDVSSKDPVIGTSHRLAQTNQTTKVAFGTEAGVFAGLGVPTIVCGPGSMADQGHKPDEYITTEALAVCDAMMGRILSEISA